MNQNILLVCFSQDLIPRHESMLRSLVAAGNTVAVITWNRSEPTQRNLDQVRYIPLYLDAPSSSVKIVFYLRHYYNAVVSHLSDEGRFDVCILTHMMTLPLTKRIEADKFVYDIPEYLNYDFSDYFGRFRTFFRPFIELFERYQIKNVDGVTYVGSRDDWLGNYVSHSRHSIEINNFPDMKRRPSANRVTELKSRYGNKKIVIYVGALTHERGVQRLIDAAKLVLSSIPEAHFILMGRLRSDTDTIIDEIQCLDFENKVEVIPHIDFEEMLAYLAIAKLGIALYEVDSRRSASTEFGKFNSRKILTYMQMGLPLLVSQGNPFSEFVLEARCGEAVNQKDIGQLSEKIIEMINIENNTKGQAGLKMIETHCNWQNEEKKFLKFLDEI